MITHAIHQLEAAKAADPALDFTDQKSLLTLTVKSILLDAIAQAEAAATNKGQHKQVLDAKSLLDAGQELLIAQDYLGAVDTFSKALSKTNFG